MKALTEDFSSTKEILWNPYLQRKDRTFLSFLGYWNPWKAKFCFGCCLETAVGNTRMLELKLLSLCCWLPNSAIPGTALMTCEVKRISQSKYILTYTCWVIVDWGPMKSKTTHTKCSLILETVHHCESLNLFYCYWLPSNIYVVEKNYWNWFFTQKHHSYH